MADQEQLQKPGNDGGGESTTESSSFPGLGHVRCYWAIMDAMMNFRYLDPVFQQHMQEQAPLMLGKNLVDFIHPDEKEPAKTDFAKFRSSTTIFGSVTRCRYARPVHCRRILGAQDPESDGEGSGKYLDENWLACRVTASVVADNTVLTFFHGLQDVDPAVDNDETNFNDWTNWCGPRVSNPSSDYLFGSNRDMLTAAFALCQDQSEETEAKIARIQQNGEAPGQAAYVFQLLDSRTTQILFTWPPTKPTGQGYDSLLYGGEQGQEQERYSAEEYATLAKSVIEKPRANVPAETNCTKRFQSTHPIFKDDQLFSIESVVITYQALTFVCFSTGGILLNGQSLSMGAGLAGVMQQQQQGHENGGLTEEQALERLRQISGEATASADLLGAYAQGTGENGYPAIPSPTHAQYASWQQQDLNDASLQSPYYQGSSFPSVYSSMFHSGSGDGGGFMSGSTSIPPMPSAAGDSASASGSAGQAGSASNGLQNLALASSTSYYSDYNPNGQYAGVGPSIETPTPATSFAQKSPVGPPGSNNQNTGPAPVLHRVRKNDRNRICTSCGSTNSPEWRKGPSGIKTLCNACGLRYARAQARKAKKAQKEAMAAAAIAAGPSTMQQQQTQSAAAASGGSGSQNISGGNTPVTYQVPGQLHIDTSNAGSSNDLGEPDSPYLNLDYSAQQQQQQQQDQQAGLPPLPQSGGSASTGAGEENTNAQDSGMGQHPGSTAPNYGGYGAFHGFTPYGEWSPAGDASFAQQQQQQQQQGQSSGAQ